MIIANLRKEAERHANIAKALYNVIHAYEYNGGAVSANSILKTAKSFKKKKSKFSKKHRIEISRRMKAYWKQRKSATKLKTSSKKGSPN